MKHLLAGASLILIAAVTTTRPAAAIDVIDDFESGNPNLWGWTNSTAGAYTIQPEGGNPGAWLDSGLPYRSDHPNLTSVPAEGTALRTALASGGLVSARFDFKRLDSGSCMPHYTLPSTFSLAFIDLHSDPDGAVIEAHTLDGPETPTGPSDWQSVGFKIPGPSDDVPAGWILNVSPDLGYTWADLLRNVDGIRFFAINPEDITYSACWQLGADNVVVSYEYPDRIFADDFDRIIGD